MKAPEQAIASQAITHTFTMMKTLKIKELKSENENKLELITDLIKKRYKLVSVSCLHVVMQYFVAC